MDIRKKLMNEASILYYEKGKTQSEIAKVMGLTRQTVSKLLNDAINERIVEIKVNTIENACSQIEQELCEKYGIKKAVVSGVSSCDIFLCQLSTVKAAANYVSDQIKKGNQKIGISWGRTIEALIAELNNVDTVGNVVFPLFGATEQEQSYFSSNELARSFADKINAKVKYAWFPYKTESAEDCNLFKKTAYFKSICELWRQIDIAIVGIGNEVMLQTFGKAFGYKKDFCSAVGDVATNFYDVDGKFLNIYDNTLSVSEENLKCAKQTIAVASGLDKAQAIASALKSKIINVLITDEYTAKKVLALK